MKPVFTLRIINDLEEKKVRIVLWDETNKCILDEDDPIPISDIVQAQLKNQQIIYKKMEIYRTKIEEIL